MKMRPGQQKNEAASEHERVQQKLRTRRDLLAAARALIDRGAEVSLAATADQAGISRATTYRYFSDPAVLALEAVLDGMVDVPAGDVVRGGPPRQAVLAVCRYWLSFYRANENRMRLLAARAMEPSPEGTPRYQRIARRLPMLEAALAPLAARLGQKKTGELALALAACTGFETYVTMKDVLRLDPSRIEAISETIVEALLDKYGVDAD